MKVTLESHKTSKPMTKGGIYNPENTVILHNGAPVLIVVLLACEQHRVVSPPPSGGLPLTAEQGSGAGGAVRAGWLFEGL